jgi:hypothetical protein
MTEVQLIEIAIGGVSGLIYGGAIYLKRRQEGEPFDGIKLAGSVIIGGSVGAAIASTGVMVTESAVTTALVFGADMGFTSLIESGFRYVYRKLTGGQETQSKRIVSMEREMDRLKKLERDGKL